MTVFADSLFSTPITQDDLEPTTGERVRATVADTFSSLVGPSLLRMGELDEARKWGGGAYGEITPEQARAAVDERGLGEHLTIEDRNYNPLELGILVSRKQAELRRQYVLQRAGGGFARGSERLLLSLGTSLLDPLTIATAFVPVVGEARYAGMLERAGASFAKRAAVRGTVGALEGSVGQALVEPIVYSAKQQEQADYTLYDSLANIAFGGVFGGGLHAVGGGVVDYRAGRRAARLAEATQGLQDTLERLAAEQSKGPPAELPMLRPPETTETVAASLDALYAGRRAKLTEQASGLLREDVRVETEARLRSAREQLAKIDETTGADGSLLRQSIADAEAKLKAHDLAAAAARDLERLDSRWNRAESPNEQADVLGVNMRSQLFEAQNMETTGLLDRRVSELEQRKAEIDQQLAARRADADPLPEQVDPVSAGPFDAQKAEIKARDIRNLEDRSATAAEEIRTLQNLADRWRGDALRSAQGRAAAASPQTREAALRGAVAQDLIGEPINVEPAFELDATTRTKPIDETLRELQTPRRPVQQTPPEVVEAADAPVIEEQIADLEQSLKDLEAELKAAGEELPAELRAEIDEANALASESEAFSEAARMLAACAMRSIA